MTTNLTEPEILEAVDNIFNHFNITQNYDIVKAIAKEYVRRGEQRDKLLERLKRNHKFIVEADPYHCLVEENDKLIAECESKDE